MPCIYFGSYLDLVQIKIRERIYMLAQMIKFIFFTCLLLLNLFTSNINAQDEFFEPTTSIGGYGELHFNNKTTNVIPFNE